ncbi:hypothetical protein BDA96_06G255700 [Sorghum bicolor]|uniref:Uncharacterized protein n=1 Tax=Sorghum bicolor TaxID=4558 RepID=A0A921QTI4_SORBI|nr:hypothetical protein BDA96_06G255700 [Sorghum bicolor]
MEAQWVVIPLLQHLLIFEADHLPPFDAILRTSLAATLATHAPLAGKLHYLADTGDVAICRSTGGGDDDRGVRFVAAECDADGRRLAGDEDHDVLTFERLVPDRARHEPAAGCRRQCSPSRQRVSLEAGWSSGSVCTTASPTVARCGGSSRRGPPRAVATRRPRRRCSTAPVSACPAARNWQGASCASTRRI